MTQLPCITCSPHELPGLRLPPSPSALQRYPAGKYAVSGDESKLPASPMAIMLRSHQLKVEEVPPTVRAIVRCGAGVNNIPVPKVGGAGSVGVGSVCAMWREHPRGLGRQQIDTPESLNDPAPVVASEPDKHACTLALGLSPR